MRRELWQSSIPFFTEFFSKSKFLENETQFPLLIRSRLTHSTGPAMTVPFYLPDLDSSLFHLSPFCGEEITNSYRMWVTGERNKSRYVTSRLFMIHQLLLMALPLFRPSGHENETWIYVFAPQNAAFVCFSLQVK